MKDIFRRINQYLLFFVLFIVVLYFGKQLLIPVVFAAMLAMLMAPVSRRLEKYKMRRGLSTAICVFILVIGVAGVAAVIAAQFAAFSKDIDKIEQKGKAFIEQAQAYIYEKSGMTPEKQEAALKEQGSKGGSSPKSII